MKPQPILTCVETQTVETSQGDSQFNIHPVANLGLINQAAKLFSEKKYIDAWRSALNAVKERPFNPEAFLLLAAIGHFTGNYTLAQKCLKHAKSMTPFFPDVQEFRKKLKGNVNGIKINLPGSETIDEIIDTNWLSVCLIAKNEESNIERCIKSVLPIAKQIIVLDTGSQDATKEIAKTLGAEVYEIEWQDDFSYARNCALEKARGGWILSLDADEELPYDQHKKLLDFMSNPSAIAYRIQLLNVGKEIEGCCYVPRLFRNIPGIFYRNRIHEQIFVSIIPWAKKWGMKIDECDVCIRHHGYKPNLTQIKNKRNLNLLLMAVKEQPEDANILMNLGLELCRSGKIDEGIEYYKKAFEIFKKMPVLAVTPEMREAFLTQYSTFLYSKGRYEEISGLLTSELAKYHNGLNASHHYLLGLSYYKLKKINDAIKELNYCISKSKNKSYSHALPDIYTGEPHYLLAICYAVLNKEKEADREFNFALECSPDVLKFNYDYARFLAGHGNFDKALAILRKILPQTATNPAVWQLGARIALNNEKLVHYALEWTEEALKYCPEDPELIEYRGDALLLNGFIEEARECFTRLPVSARQKACIIFCEAMSGSCSSTVEMHEESVVSHEIIRLYRRCLNSKANNLILCFNQHIHVLQPILPSAHRILTTALRQAEIDGEE